MYNPRPLKINVNVKSSVKFAVDILHVSNYEAHTVNTGVKYRATSLPIAAILGSLVSSLYATLFVGSEILLEQTLSQIIWAHVITRLRFAQKLGSPDSSMLLTPPRSRPALSRGCRHLLFSCFPRGSYMFPCRII